MEPLFVGFAFIAIVMATVVFGGPCFIFWTFHLAPGTFFHCRVVYCCIMFFIGLCCLAGGMD